MKMLRGKLPKKYSIVLGLLLVLATGCTHRPSLNSTLNSGKEAAKDYKKQCKGQLPLGIHASKQVDPQMDRWTCE